MSTQKDVKTMTKDELEASLAYERKRRSEEPRGHEIDYAEVDKARAEAGLPPREQNKTGGNTQ